MLLIHSLLWTRVRLKITEARSTFYQFKLTQITLPPMHKSRMSNLSLKK